VYVPFGTRLKTILSPTEARGRPAAGFFEGRSSLRSIRLRCFEFSFWVFPAAYCNALATAAKNAVSLKICVDESGFGRALNITITSLSFGLMYMCCPKIPMA
jgi:hypothetical protein